MKNKKTNELNNEELLKKRKSLQVLTCIFVGALSVMLCAKIISIIVKGFNVSSLFPIVFLPFLVINFNSLWEIKNELRSRGLNL